MNHERTFIMRLAGLCLVGALFASIPILAASKKTLRFSDLMAFRESRNLSISRNNEWIAFTSRPDFGLSDALAVRCADGHTVTLPGHEEPELSADGAHLIAYQAKDPSLFPDPDEKKTEGRVLTLLHMASGKKDLFQQVYAAAFDLRGEWLFVRYMPEKAIQNVDKQGQTAEQKEDIDTVEKASVLLIQLSRNQRTYYQNISSAAMDPDSQRLALVGDGRLTLLDLSSGAPTAQVLFDMPKHVFGQPVWSEKRSRLAILVSVHPRAEMEQHPKQSVHIWQPGRKTTREIPHSSLPQDWIIPPKSPLKWDLDGEHLDIGTRPLTEYRLYSPAPLPRPTGRKITQEPYTDLLADRALDVWHWQDPQIKSQEKAQQKRRVEQTYTALYTLSEHRLLQLGGPDMQRVTRIDGCPAALGFDNSPYSQETTWDGFYEDVYRIDLKAGTRHRVLTRHQQPLSLSPKGRYLAYFQAGNWHLYDMQSQSHRNLTGFLPHSFADEDHDTPDDPRPYGLAGWLEKDEALFLYDRFDIWRFDLPSDRYSCITSGQGRLEQISFRRQKTNKTETAIPVSEIWLLTAYSEKEKWTRFYRSSPSAGKVMALSDGDFSYRFLLAGDDQSRMLFSRERLEVYPDIWISDLSLSSPRQLTRLNPQIEEFNWGRAELMKWKSIDGVDLEGVVIKPEDYQPGRTYPMIVYYYELSADRLLRYNQTVVNHRPSFPLYASNGYVLFLPDIRFQSGRPGQSAVECLVPGVLKLIDIGLADPKAIALHGHSWSGYQTAFVITQSELFACALAGAPVSNMTSAYSGIRWGEGIARQFQYEKSQSRIGRTLFDAPHLYIENSPVFFAERINTPLLIQHGDEDEAVPWKQSIELYLAMRRLGKPCVFLQYKQEPHHLKAYANKLDYSIKMKEFFDHFLRAAPAPAWWQSAAPAPAKAPFEKKKSADR